MSNRLRLGNSNLPLPDKRAMTDGEYENMKSSNNKYRQELAEGIMMRHKRDKYSIAVRRPDGEIELKVEDFCTLLLARRNLAEASDPWSVSGQSGSGNQMPMYSAEIAGDEEDEKEMKNAALQEERAAKKKRGQTV